MIDRRSSGNSLDVFTVGHIGVTSVLHEAVHGFHVINQNKDGACKYEDHGDDAQGTDTVKAKEDICRPR